MGSFTFWPIYPLEKAAVPIEWLAGWAPESVRRFEGGNIFPIYLIKKRNSAAIRLKFLISKRRYFYGLAVMGFLFEADLPCPTSGMSLMGSETL